MLNKVNISSKEQILIVYVVLAAITLAVFWQVSQYDFIKLDDNIYVTNNFRIKSGISLEGIRWAFSTTYAQFWHPLTWLSLMFDYQLFGLNAGGYHMTNLILHILSTLLLFWAALGGQSKVNHQNAVLFNNADQQNDTDNSNNVRSVRLTISENTAPTPAEVRWKE